MKELTKDDMYAVEVRGGLEREEELAAVGVRPGVGHGEEARLVVRNAEVFVREGRAVDALSARAVGVGEVAALSHEAGDDAMEDGAFVMQLLA